MQNIIIKQSDNYKINIFHYPSSFSEIKGCILFLNDMRDHHERYEDFFRVLNIYGYIVYTYDYRGHGKSLSVSELGQVASKNGHQILIDDLVSVSKKIENDNPNTSKYIIGIGLGSTLAEYFMNIYPNSYKESCWSGFALISPFHKSIAYCSKKMFNIKIRYLFSKENNKPSIKESEQFFSGKSYHSFGNRTSFDWISKNNNEVGMYIHDPYCGFYCSPSFFYDYYKLCKLSFPKKNKALTDNNITLLIISGSDDAFADMGESVNKKCDIYKKLGIRNIRKIIYKNFRHDLFHDKDYDLVYEDILHWLDPSLIIE